MTSTDDCLACRLTAGEEPLPGGTVAQTPTWLVEHCVGPLGVGTLVVKPKRHVLNVWELSDGEVAEMGPLLREAARVISELTRCDRTYIALWSHPDWQPTHIHYVVQPVFNAMRAKYTNGGPTLQSEMFSRNEPLPEAEVIAFCDQARALFDPSLPARPATS